MDRTPPPKFVKASRIEICRPCPTCRTTTTHVYHHWEPDEEEEIEDGTLIYGCSECGEPRRVSWDEAGEEESEVGDEFKIAMCGPCERITFHLSHPSGWMCKRCKHCREALQSVLGEHPRRPA